MAKDFVQNAQTSPPDAGEGPAPSRRHFLLLGLSVLVAGCSAPATSSTLPGPTWRSTRRPAPTPSHEPPRPAPRPEPAPESMTNVISRAQWANGNPVYSRMNRMTPVRYITVHHDGMSPFYGSGRGSAADRIEAIRRVHCDQWRWGDIGYHYVVDRDGRVWAGRPIEYQGAHVRNHNEGNVGILALGNFDEQQPSQAQLDGVSRAVSWLMREHRVPVSRVYTHMEWDGAVTACPGRSLQSYMERIRSQRQLG